MERYRLFCDCTYGPVGDVEIDPETGLLKWSVEVRKQNPDLVRRVAEYFERRRRASDFLDTKLVQLC